MPDHYVYILVFPILGMILILSVRLGVIWYERQLIRKHVKRLYLGALNYIKGNDDPRDLEILSVREALYQGVLMEQKVYQQLLKRLEELLQTQDKRLQESFTYLDRSSHGLQ